MLFLFGTYDLFVLVQPDLEGRTFWWLRGRLAGRPHDGLKDVVNVDWGPAFSGGSKVLGQPKGINPFCRDLKCINIIIYLK